MKVELDGLIRYRSDAISAAKAGVEKNAARIEAHAKKLAPIRKVFPGAQGDQPTRKMTKAEVKEVADIFKGMKSLSATQRRGAVASLKANPYIAMPSRANRLSRTGAARRSFIPLGKDERINRDRGGAMSIFGGGPLYRFGAFGQLSAQGRAELKRGMKDYEAGSFTSVIKTPIKAASSQEKERFGVTYRVQLGGRLKRDIEREQSQFDGKMVTGNVTSNAPYSRFVEFPTRRTRAQPFLRPALKAQQTRLQADLAATFRSELQG